jgi:HK97 family phage major capsid protein
VAIHPRDLTKFDLAADTTNRYLFEGGLARQLPNLVVPDANIPTNLGAGTKESIIIVGDFDAGGYFFERQPLTIEASRDAGWHTDETVFRGVERYGFALVVPGAFEILTGITP